MFPGDDIGFGGSIDNTRERGTIVLRDLGLVFEMQSSLQEFG